MSEKMDETSSCMLPVGFRAAGVHCGIKHDPSKLDLALFVADGPTTAAGVFTTSLVCGAPVRMKSRLSPSSAGVLWKGMLEVVPVVLRPPAQATQEPQPTAPGRPSSSIVDLLRL